MWETLRKGKKVGPNPWDGMTLEWVTESPPIGHNFEFLPPIRSERPVWDLNHPEHLTLPHGRHAKEMARQAALAGAAVGGARGTGFGGPVTEGNGHGDRGHGNGDSAGNGAGGDGNGSSTPGDGGDGFGGGT